MIGCRTVLAGVLLLVAIGCAAGCGVGVDASPRPLDPVTTVPLQPAPTVVERPDDRSASCPPSPTRPTPAPDVPAPPTPPPTTKPC